MNLRLIFFVFGLFSFLFVSCEADIDLNNVSNEVSLHPDLIVPIGGASLSLGQIILNNDSAHRFIIGDDSEISYLSFDSLKFILPTLNFLENSQELIRNIQLSPVVAYIPSNTSVPTILSNDTLRLGINTNNANHVDSILVKTATISLIVDVSSDLASINPADLKFSIVFPNGKVRMLDGSSSTQSISPTGFGLINYKKISNFMMSTSDGESGMPIQILIDVKTGALPLILTPASTITCKINFTNLDYSVAYGNFKSDFNLTQTLQQHIDLNKNFPTGSLKFANPKISISASSNVGAYLNFKIDYIKAFLSTNQNVLPVFASFDGVKYTNIEFKRKPTSPGDTINVGLQTLDKDWGGTDKFFEREPIPDMLEYHFSASVDSVLNSTDRTPNFITSDANIKVMLKTIVPLNFTKGSYYQFQDSITNVFSAISNALSVYPYTDITYTALVLNISNGLPVKTTFTFELIDSLGYKLQTTFEKKYVIAAGKVDANGLVQPGQETKQTLQIVVTKEQLSILKKAKTIRYIVRIEGEELNSNIHFTKWNTFDLKVGLFVKGDINTTIGTKTQK